MDAWQWLLGKQNHISMGLHNITQLLYALGNPQLGFHTVLVGGTNGKGSTATVLAHLMHHHHHNTGLFTSPHLSFFSERFWLNGRYLQPNEIMATLETLRPDAEALGCSFFEIITALACVLFKNHDVKWAVFEVGMGGLTDATNALEPVAAMVTNVGLDHTAFLGNTIPEIATQKAGIFRQNKVALTAATGAGLQTLKALQQPLYALGEDITYQATSAGWQGNSITIQSPFGLAHTTCNLLGQYQIPNIVLAVSCAMALGLTIPQTINVTWAGRLERLNYQGHSIILDGAHNPEGVASCLASLRALGIDHAPVVFAAMQDKDIPTMAQYIGDFASEVIVSQAQYNPRSTPPEQLATYFKHFQHCPVHITHSPQEALQHITAPLTVGMGSLYFIGELRPLILGLTPETYIRYQ